MIANTARNIHLSISVLHNYLRHDDGRENKWFKKAAMILSLNTKINIQKSFWRMKFNVETPGVVFNTASMVKLRKMYNNIRKYYQFNMIRSFFMIGQHSKAVSG